MPSKTLAALGAASLLLAPLAAGADSARGGAAPRIAPAPHGARAVRRPHDSSTCSGAGANSFVGGGTSNNAYGSNTAVLAGQSNTACDDWATIAGGYSNSISTGGNDYALYSFIGGGYGNKMSGVGSVIGAGTQNDVTGENDGVLTGISNTVSGDYGFIGAGDSNAIATSAAAVIGGGAYNTITAQNVGETAYSGGTYGVIGGGYKNSILGTADGRAQDATVGGGYTNAVTGSFSTIAGGEFGAVSGTGATLGGGEYNAVTGSGATVPGGYKNVASGAVSFAAGYRAEALAQGTFVWSDDSPAGRLVAATTPNEFLARATGGVVFYSNAALTSGVSLAPGSGTWSQLSDRTLKTGVAGVDDARILAKVASLPVSEWSYVSERGVRHIGPMAQDFYAAFGVGEDDRHITSIDEDGVALAAVKALHAENVSLQAENASLRARNSTLGARVTSLESQEAALQSDEAALRGEVEQLERNLRH